MKLFLRKSILFILPIISVVIILELLLRQIPNDYSYKKEFLDKNIEDIEVLFLGSSHAYYGINPKLIEIPSFNASHISQTIDLDFEILKKYEDRFQNLDFIVIPIDYFTLFSQMSTGEAPWRIKNYNIYYNFCMTSNINYYFELFSINLDNNKSRLISYYLKNESSITCNKLGYGNIEREQVDLVETGKTAAKRHTIETKSYFDENLNIVNEINKLAIDSKIRILFYTSPAYSTYRKNIEETQLNKTISSITLIANKNENCYYLNLLDDNRFKEKDFRDADHLNKHGAKKLTKIIYAELKKLKHEGKTKP